MSTFAATCQFNTVCESLENIFKLKGPNKKTEELLKLLQNCRELGDKSKNKNKDTDISLYPILRLLLPQLERERGPHGLKEKSLTSLYNRIFCLGKETLNSRNQSKYRADYTGEDLADRVYNAVRNQLQSDKSSLSVKKINEFLDSISNKNESNKKIDTTFLTIAKKLSAFEFKWLTRIVLKDLKLGIGEKKILKAFHPNAEKLFDVTSNLREICERLSVESSVEKPRIRTFFHVKPMLLERCKIEDIGKLFRDQSSQYFVQIKYDGERSQIHMKDGKFKYFTRMGHDITKNTAYGETSDSEGFLSKNIARLLKIDCYSLILDGEIMGWHKEKKRFGSKGMTYDVKKLTTNSAYQPCFIAFDIILYNDELLVDLPYSERLQKLEKLFEDKEGVMIKGKTSRVSNSEQIVEFFNESLDKKEEGIVVKECDMLYKPNVRAGSGCYKIKAEYSDGLIQDMDLIILGAYYGDGRAAGKLNSFLMGVSEPSVKEADKPAKFQSVVSVSSGLNYEQLKELQKQFQLKGQLKCPETVVGPRKNPPDVWINPKDSVILQLRATEIIRSSFYPSGYSLRFPRVLAVRDDKPWYSVCSSSEFLSFVKDTGFVQKLTKRHATNLDGENIQYKKLPRQSAPSKKKIDERFLGIQRFDIVRISRLLEGKEICVLNGNEEMPINEIQKILFAHAAEVVQNPGTKTFCVIVGNPAKTKTNNAMQNPQHDFVTLSWLKRVTENKNWYKLEDFYPCELLSAQFSTKNRIQEMYDKFDDNFADDAGEHSFKCTVKKTEIEVENQNFSIADFEEMDKDLFEKGSSPFSVFRSIVGYFHNPEDNEKFTFRFMAGTISTNINEHVTHIFIEEDSPSIIEYFAGYVTDRQPQIKIMKIKWIADCFKKRTLLEGDNYIVNVNNFT